MTKALYRYPAEWEKQEATWLAFPHNKLNWHGERGVKIRKFYVELIRTISEFQPVNVLVPNKKFLTLDEKFAVADRPYPASFFMVKTDDIWIRDYGPFFVKKGKETVVSETVFNAWGAKFPPWKNDNQIPGRIADLLEYKKGVSVPYIFEGGAIEVNGDGLGMTTLDCLVGKNRNKVEDLSKVIKAICEMLGLRALLVLPKGLVGDHTDGHIDNVARFRRQARERQRQIPGRGSRRHFGIPEAPLRQKSQGGHHPAAATAQVARRSDSPGQLHEFHLCKRRVNLS